jgi:hypothetical protein
LPSLGASSPQLVRGVRADLVYLTAANHDARSAIAWLGRVGLSEQLDALVANYLALDRKADARTTITMLTKHPGWLENADCLGLSRNVQWLRDSPSYTELRRRTEWQCRKAAAYFGVLDHCPLFTHRWSGGCTAEVCRFGLDGERCGGLWNRADVRLAAARAAWPKETPTAAVWLTYAQALHEAPGADRVLVAAIENALLTVDCDHGPQFPSLQRLARAVRSRVRPELRGVLDYVVRIDARICGKRLSPTLDGVR